MRVRSSGVAITLALVLAAGAGAAIGYAVGTDEDRAPTAFEARPLAAASPSYPVIPAEVVADDDHPALEPGRPTRRVEVGTPPFQVDLPVPRGLFRSNSASGEWRWYADRELTWHLYFMRVKQVDNLNKPVPIAVEDRISDLRGATGIDELAIESRRPDRFVVTYVTGQHRRVAFEGFLERRGVAYVQIVVTGREADRAGLSDLFRRLMDGTRI